MKARSIWIVGLALLLAVPAASWAQSDPHIKLTSEALIEKQVVNAEGKKQIQRVKAAKVVPGSEVIFVTTYHNVSNQKAEKAVITNPVAAQMIYTQGSARGKGSRITFSIDNGKSFNIPAKLFVFDAAGRKFPAQPKDYTHIRWEMNHPLPPGAKGEVSFRAILK